MIFEANAISFPSGEYTGVVVEGGPVHQDALLGPFQVALHEAARIAASGGGAVTTPAHQGRTAARSPRDGIPGESAPLLAVASRT